MFASPAFLTLCDKMKSVGLFSRWDPPIRLARGYADLGYEEFCLLPGGNLFSLETGKLGNIPSEHEQFFFQVPSIQEMVNELDSRGFDLNGLFYQEQRTWKLVIIDSRTSVQSVFENREIEMVLADALLSLSGGS